eukprot:6182543-Pleurochrysis_carterae.AAC.3
MDERRTGIPRVVVRIYSSVAVGMGRMPSGAAEARTLVAMSLLHSLACQDTEARSVSGVVYKFLGAGQTILYPFHNMCWPIRDKKRRRTLRTQRFIDDVFLYP